jgi:hypothetical protein
MFYQNQTDKRQEAEDELEVVQDTMLMLLSQRGAMEATLDEKENELIQWEDSINQLNEQLAQSEVDLSQIQQQIPVSAESIEYDEILFSYAEENDIELFAITASEIGDADIEGVNYGTVTFGMGIRGEMEDILNFINTIVTSDDFKTATLTPVGITIPDPLDDEEIYNLEQGLRGELTAAAIAEIPAGEIILITFESVVEVFGTEYVDQLTQDNDGSITTNSLEEMAAILKDRIAGSIYLEPEFEEPLAYVLAKNIEEGLANSVVGIVVSSVAQKIDELVVIREVIEGEEEGQEEIIIDQEALIELVGYDLAVLIGDQIAGLTSAPIEDELNSYVAGLIEEKMIDSVADSVEEEVENRMPAIIEAEEKPTASMTILIYIYQHGGE